MTRPTPEVQSPSPSSPARQRIHPNYRELVAAIESLDALLRLELRDAEHQWEQIGQREPYVAGRRQSDFTPVEVVLSHGASLLVEHRQFGGSTSNDAPNPVRLLASLFHRPPSSVLAKMANLDGSRPHGGRFDHAAGLVWVADPSSFDSVYATTLLAARRRGIGRDRLPDFLDTRWQA